MKNRKDNCVFCKNGFPHDYQLVSKAPRYWILILSVEPQCDFHCLIVLKASIIDKIGHISHVGDKRLPYEVMSELGSVLNKFSIAITKSDSTIEKILVVSLNTGKGSEHLHFHLIPKRYEEPVKMVNKPDEDGGGMFFLGRKEIVASTFSDFLDSTTGTESEELKNKIIKATKAKVTKNAQRLRKIFNEIWIVDNNPIQRTANSRR